MEISILSAPTHDGAVVVAVRGEVDFSNADELADCLRVAIADRSPEVVRVELGQASFIDSTGLGALIQGYRAATEARVRFVVVDPTPTFRRVLTVTGLCDLFGLTAREDEGSVASTQAGA